MGDNKKDNRRSRKKRGKKRSWGKGLEEVGGKASGKKSCGKIPQAQLAGSGTKKGLRGGTGEHTKAGH